MDRVVQKKPRRYGQTQSMILPAQNNSKDFAM